MAVTVRDLDALDTLEAPKAPRLSIADLDALDAPAPIAVPTPAPRVLRPGPAPVALGGTDLEAAFENIARFGTEMREEPPPPKPLLTKPLLSPERGKAAIQGIRQSAIGTGARLLRRGLGGEPAPVEEVVDPDVLDRTITGLTGIATDLPIIVTGGVVGGTAARQAVKWWWKQLLKREAAKGGLTTAGGAALRASEALIRGVNAVVGASQGGASLGLEDAVKEAVRQAAGEAEYQREAPAEGMRPGRIATEGAKGAALGGLTFGLSSQVPPGVLEALTEAGVFGAAGPPIHEGRAPTLNDLVESGVQIGVIAGAFRLAKIRPPKDLTEILPAGAPSRGMPVGSGATAAAQAAQARAATPTVRRAPARPAPPPPGPAQPPVEPAAGPVAPPPPGPAPAGRAIPLPGVIQRAQEASARAEEAVSKIEQLAKPQTPTEMQRAMEGQPPVDVAALDALDAGQETPPGIKVSEATLIPTRQGVVVVPLDDQGKEIPGASHFAGQKPLDIAALDALDTAPVGPVVDVPRVTPPTPEARVIPDAYSIAQAPPETTLQVSLGDDAETWTLRVEGKSRIWRDEDGNDLSEERLNSVLDKAPKGMLAILTPPGATSESAPPRTRGFTRVGTVDYRELPAIAERGQSVYTTGGDVGRIVGEDAEHVYVSHQAGSMARVAKYRKDFIEASQAYWSVGNTIQTKDGPAEITAAPRLDDRGFRAVGVRFPDGTERTIPTRAPFITDMPSTQAPEAVPETPRPPAPRGAMPGRTPAPAPGPGGSPTTVPKILGRAAMQLLDAAGTRDLTPEELDRARGLVGQMENAPPDLVETRRRLVNMLERAAAVAAGAVESGRAPVVGDRVVMTSGRYMGDAGTVTRIMAGKLSIRLDNGRAAQVPTLDTHVTAAGGTVAPAEGGGARVRPALPARRARPPDQGPLEEVPPEDVRGAGEVGPPGGGGVPREGTDLGRPLRPDREPGPPAGPSRGAGDARVGVPAERAGAAEPELRPAEPGEPPAGREPKSEPEPERKPARDFRITDAEDIGAGSPRQKAARNLDAIRLLKKIEEAGRPATPEEQAVLVRYVGWGGIPQPLDAREWNIPKEWQGVAEDLRGLLTPEEMDAARASTPNAHFTSPMVVSAMWKAVQRLGFRAGGRMIEPSAGVGHFFGLMPEDLRAGTRRIGVELDQITGRIAQLLYPEANIKVTGFEKVRLPDSFVDLAISNVPFGDYGIHDPRYRKWPAILRSIHNYFFAKALDIVRPGGVVAFITSHYTMDAHNSSVRHFLSERADLLGAIRLPNTAFKATAGTEVTADIIFLQKRAPGTEVKGEAWLDVQEFKGKGGVTIPAVNEYFVRHPEMMLGELALEGTQYRKDEVALVGTLMPEALDAAIQRLPENVIRSWEAPTAPETAEAALAPDTVKEGAYAVREGQIVQKRGTFWEPVAAGAEDVSRIKGMMGIRDAARDVLRTQMQNADEAEIVSARDKLNKVYDAFVRRQGFLWSKKNAKAFDGDPDAPLLLALEEWDADTQKATKAPFFSRRVFEPYRPAEKAETADEALAISLNEMGRIDWTRMQELTGHSPKELQELLGHMVYRNPDGEAWETADAYLSGNVREKLRVAEAAAEHDGQYRRNVEALERVQPEDLTPAEIDARLGVSWIPVEDVRAFIGATLGLQESWYTLVYVPQTATWSLTAPLSSRGRIQNATDNSETWGTARYFGHDLLSDALNYRTPVVYDTVRDANGEHRILNEAETLAAREKLAGLNARFQEWIWEDETRATRLARRYNDLVNTLKLREFDGSHMTFPGMSKLTLRKGDLDPHQKNAVWRVVQEGKAILAHAIGAGKTFEIIAATMELRRLKLARKIMVVVKNSTLSDWAPAFQRLYPNSRPLILSTEDMGKGKRERTLAKIATGEYDAIVVPHSTFEFIRVSEESFKAYMQRQLDELGRYIIEARAESENPRRDPTVKELEKAKKRLEEKLEKRAKKEKKDVGGLEWEELGIDFLFVDESHAFKALYFPTKQTRVSGLSTSESDRAFDMYIKTQELLRRNNGKGVVFATGTPITNTIAEVFTLQRYLQPEILDETGLSHFDAWSKAFAESVTSWEVAPGTNKMRQHTRFIKFTNAPELMRQMRLVMDVQTSAMLKLPTPDLEGGKSIQVIVQASKELRAFIQTLIRRMEAFKHRYDPRIDNPLKVTTDGRKAALDIRLVLPGAKDYPDSKVNQAVKNIFEEWQKGRTLTQLVFLDLSRPPESKSDRRFSVYTDIKTKLVRRGVPESEIAFIYDADTDEALVRLFQRVNAGQVRILMGSSEKMGVGVNVQKRAKALHHLDAPWRPDQIEQREGRILRQGNTNTSVRIYQYGTADSFDAYIWQLLEGKAKFIADFMRGDFSRRTIEDINTIILTYEEMKALTTGNPLVMEKVKVDAEIRRLDNLRVAHENARIRMRQEIVQLPDKIAAHEKLAEEIRADMKTRDDHPDFILVLGGKTYDKDHRKEAAEALQKLILKQQGALTEAQAKVLKDQRKRAPLVTLGTFRGFEILATPTERWTEVRKIPTVKAGKIVDETVEVERVGASSVYLDGRHRYWINVNEENPVGTLESIESTLRHLDGKEAAERGEAAEKAERLRKLKAQGEHGYENEAKLRALSERQQQINKELATDKPQVDLAEDVPEDVLDLGEEEGGEGAIREEPEPPVAPSDRVTTDRADEVTRENLGQVREQKRKEEQTGRSTVGFLAGPIGRLLRRRRGPPPAPTAPEPLGAGGAGGRRPPARGTAPGGEDDMERVLSATATRGLPWLGEKIAAAWTMAKRAVIFEYDLRGFPLEQDEIRIFDAAKHRAAQGAGEDVTAVVGGLGDVGELEVLGRLVVLRDLRARASDPDRFPGGVPGGLSVDAIEAELQRYQDSAPERVRDALDKHTQLMDAEAEDLDARGQLPPEQRIPGYFPHFILDFEREPSPEVSGTRRIQQPRRPFLRRARGSERLMETDYIRAMFNHRLQVRWANAIDDFALSILERHDRADALTKEQRRALRPGQIVSSLSVVGPKGEIIPGAERYKAIQYRKGRGIFGVQTVPEAALADALASGASVLELDLDELRARGALGRYYRIYVVPEAIADRFENFGPEQVAEGLRLLNEGTSRWKGVTIGFWGQAGNVLNLTGDLVNLARTPGALLELPAAVRDVLQWKLGTGSDMVRLMEKYDVLRSGFVANEVAFRARAPELRQFLSRAQLAKRIALDRVGGLLGGAVVGGLAGGPAGMVLGGSIGAALGARHYFLTVPEVREAVPRAAMFRYQMGRLQRGRALRTGGLSITGLEGERAAGKLAREFTTDYPKHTPFENRLLRGLLLPFYAWPASNTPNWLRFFWRAKLGLLAVLGIRFLMELWNNDDEERRVVEQSLPPWKRNTAHVITGWRDEHGKMIVVYLAGDPIADAVGMVGLAGTPSRLSDLATGRLTLSQATRRQLEAFVAEPGGRAVNLLSPFVKVPGEVYWNIRGLTGQPITPRELRGTSEDYARRTLYAVESLFRPLRETRMLREQAGTKEGFDPLSHRFGLGLPFERVAPEEARQRVAMQQWYEAMSEYVEARIDALRNHEAFIGLAPHQREIVLREEAGRARNEFSKALPAPVPRRERLRQRMER